LYDNFKESKEIFEKACDVLGFDLIKLCFEGPIEELTKTENAQPAILTTSIAAYKLLEKNKIEPFVCAGHSLGEYSAYVAAGVMSFEDGVKAVRERGLAMAGADPTGKGTMAAIMGLKDDNAIYDICKEASSAGIVVPANFNCPGQIVVSGEKEGVRKAMEVAKAAGAKIVKELVVSGAFHSPLMEGALAKFKGVIDKIELKEGRCAVVANESADVVALNKVKESLIKQMVSSVLWTKSVEKMKSLGAEAFVEVGEGKVLQGLIKKADRASVLYGVSDDKSLEDALSGLKA
jgi:[acyl-carrier-protein] S-malonyltransferase